MSEDMRHWRPLASRVGASLKNYLAPTDPTYASSSGTRPGLSPVGGEIAARATSWGQWAGQKIKKITQTDGEAAGSSVHRLYLFPGWAARRYHQPDPARAETPDPGAFDVHVFVSGWASSQSAAGVASRSQRAFIRLAKGYASLPRLPNPLEPTTDEEDREEEAEMRALEDQLRRVDMSENGSPSSSPVATSPISRSPSASSTVTLNTSMAMSSGPITTNLSQLHANLELRLQPFWASVLSNRTVRVSLFASADDLPHPQRTADDGGYGPIAQRLVQTGADGSFQATVTVPWEVMCTHPRALHIAFDDALAEHDLFVLAELLAPPPAPVPAPQAQYAQYAQYAPPPTPPVPRAPTARVTARMALSHCPVRVISDIDDTVKHSNILSGARAVFYNVFVKDLADALIPGMPEWYNSMWQRGVRFHYVSNSPFELLPVLNEFFQISNLPPGSVKLRSYAGRQLFNGILSAPASRKRAGVLDVLASFPDARFILIGDSGEQDLELYGALAAERSHQVLAVFVRDVHAPAVPGARTEVDPVDDPTGASFGRRTSFPPLTSTPSTPGRLTPRIRTPRPPSRATSDHTPTVAPTPTPRAGSGSYAPYMPRGKSSSLSNAPVLVDDYFTGSRANANTFTDAPLAAEPESNEGSSGAASPASPVGSYSAGWYGAGPGPSGAGPPPISEAERKRQELQARIYRARALIPPHIVLRIFRQPEDCVEAAQILDQLKAGIVEDTRQGA